VCCVYPTDLLLFLRRFGGSGMAEESAFFFSRRMKGKRKFFVV